MNNFIDIMAEKMQFLECENEQLEARLKSVAKSIQSLKIDQPPKCLFDNGVCGYPINDCYNCPVHSWSNYVPTVKREIK